MMTRPLSYIYLALSGFGCERSGHVIDTCGEFLIEGIETHAVVADKFQTIDESLRGLLLFHLLRYEPVELAAGGIIVLGLGERVYIVDKCCHLLLVGESSLECGKRACPFSLDSSNG